MRTLGLNFADPVHHWAIRTPLLHMKSYEQEGEGALRLLAGLGVGQDKFRQVSREASEQNGVLLALSAQHTEGFLIVDGDRPGWDKRVVAPGGSPLRGIAGIEPLGNNEYEFFERLQAAIETAR